MSMEAVVDLLEESRLQPCQIFLHLDSSSHGRDSVLESGREKVLTCFLFINEI
jgi:hypothetical protein